MDLSKTEEVLKYICSVDYIRAASTRYLGGTANITNTTVAAEGGGRKKKEYVMLSDDL